MRLLRDVLAGRHAALAPLFIRVPVGVHLIHGTQDNVFSWGRMLEFRDFLAQHGFPLPLACAVISVAAQFIAGALYLVGFQTRWAALVMSVNFVVAILAVHVAHDHPYPAVFPALTMLGASLFLLFAGPGALSLDQWTRVPQAKAL